MTRNLSQSQAELKLKEVSMIKKHDTIFVVILFLKPMLRSLPVFEKVKKIEKLLAYQYQIKRIIPLLPYSMRRADF